LKIKHVNIIYYTIPLYNINVIIVEKMNIYKINVLITKT